MKLQRYDMEAVSYSGAWVKEIPSDDGDWVKASDAEALEKRVLELEKALRDIVAIDASIADCGCCEIAKKALEGE